MPRPCAQEPADGDPSGQALKVGSEERKTYPTPTTFDHSKLLNKAERDCWPSSWTSAASTTTT